MGKHAHEKVCACECVCVCVWVCVCVCMCVWVCAYVRGGEHVTENLKKFSKCQNWRKLVVQRLCVRFSQTQSVDDKFHFGSDTQIFFLIF